MALYRDMLSEEEGVHVPERIPDLSSGRLLTMTWLDGEPLLNCAEAPPKFGTLLPPICSAPGTYRFIITLSFTVIRILKLQRSRRPIDQSNGFLMHPEIRRLFVRGVIDLY